jgi:uncharacterized protein (DUF952 family)
VSVIFHIATGRDWERATSSGTYTTESMHSHGLIGCFSPEQHAAAANQVFAGRTDLVLLLIDTDRLESEVRVEQADAHGQPLPCVYGPLNRDAVFERRLTGRGPMDGSTPTRRPAGSRCTARRPSTRPGDGRSR